jgi:hypothetical protein
MKKQRRQVRLNLAYGRTVATLFLGVATTISEARQRLIDQMEHVTEWMDTVDRWAVYHGDKKIM